MTILYIRVSFNRLDRLSYLINTIFYKIKIKKKMLTKVSQNFLKGRQARAFSTIAQVKAREIIDSRGNPTVEADVILKNGQMFRAAVPSGASTGVYEALELRDKDASRFLGKGCLTAVNNVNTILSPGLVGMDVKDQVAIDKKMVE